MTQPRNRHNGPLLQTPRQRAHNTNWEVRFETGFFFTFPLELCQSANS